MARTFAPMKPSKLSDWPDRAWFRDRIGATSEQLMVLGCFALGEGGAASRIVIGIRVS